MATTADSWMKALTPDEPDFYSRGMDAVPDSENLIDASVYGSTAPLRSRKTPTRSLLSIHRWMTARNPN